jgi:hypothetical protein
MCGWLLRNTGFRQEGMWACGELCADECVCQAQRVVRRQRLLLRVGLCERRHTCPLRSHVHQLQRMRERLLRVPRFWAEGVRADSKLQYSGEPVHELRDLP